MKKLLLNILILTLIFNLAGCYSCRTWNNLWGTGPVKPGTEHKFFFDKECQPVAKAAPAPAPKPEPKPAAKKEVVASNACGASMNSGSYPCDSCVIIQLDKTMPEQVQLNAPFEYTILVKNMTDMSVANVVVTDYQPKNLTIQSVSPEAANVEGKLVWQLGTFEPKESKLLTVSGKATNTDCIKTCATVTYTMLTCASTSVIEPQLKLVKTAPAEALICDPIVVNFVLSNSGTGSTGNIRVEDILPAGLETTKGQNKVVFDAGSLAAGETRKYAVTLNATKPGKYVNKATATAGSLKSESEATTIVRQPVLAISKTGPSKQYIGRPVSYEIKVTNKGDATAADTTLTDTIPAGVSKVMASDGGKASGSSVVWNLGSLAAGASKTVTVSYVSATAGTLTDTAKATATCSAEKEVTASAKTTISGIAAVLLEVIDIDDPIEVGGTETYVITATNQGSAPDTNIKIVCTLEDNEQYVSSSGATKGSAAGNVITFEPLPSLAPKAQATWRVTVKAVKAGDVRFTAVMNTDQLTREVRETEATHLYE